MRLSLRRNMQSVSSPPVPLGLLVRRWPERRTVVLATALVSLTGVVAAVVTADDPSLGLSFLAVIPIVLVSLEFGQRVGLAVAVLALGAVLLAAAFGRPELSAVAIFARGFVFLAAAAAVGHFSDRMRAAHAREERLLRSGLRLSEASRREYLAEIAVSEALRTTGVIGATVGIDGIAEHRAGSHSGSRTVIPMVAHGIHVGTLDAFYAGAPATEELAALKLLARQVAIVAESLRLLDLDGERAALEARLREVRHELLESRSGTGLLLRAEEAGKRRAAEKLHEDLAQVLSAVLLGMRMLERSRSEDGPGQLAELHVQVARVLADVRDVARGLRPIVLDQLGLAAALGALSRAAQDRGSRASVAVGTLPAELPDDVETAVFRLVEDALTEGADVTVAADGGGVEIGIDVEAPAPDSVLALRARTESAGGTLSVSTRGGVTTLHATMPVG
jgi:signal transduction histidine kinase